MILYLFFSTTCCCLLTNKVSCSQKVANLTILTENLKNRKDEDFIPKISRGKTFLSSGPIDMLAGQLTFFVYDPDQVL